MNKITPSPTELLFSYGTLQNPKVQLETFGRKLQGYKDKLLDYQLTQIKIKDAAVLALSGKTHHPIAVPNIGKSVSGKVFKITQAELAYADKYEVSDYKRLIGQLASGKQAWVYVQAFD